MYYHLIVRYNKTKKWEESFTSSVHPEIEAYLTELGVDDLKEISLNLEAIKKIAFSIEKSLIAFFSNNYKEPEFISQRAKEVEFKGEKYFLELPSPQIHSVRLYNTFQQVIKNNGDIILYGEKYLESYLLRILEVINKEKINNTKSLIERIEFGKTLHFDVFEGLLELERKGFVHLKDKTIVATEKGQIGN